MADDPGKPEGGRAGGETIRSINGALACNGGNPVQVSSRVELYLEFTAILKVEPGENLRCGTMGL